MQGGELVELQRVEVGVDSDRRLPCTYCGADLGFVLDLELAQLVAQTHHRLFQFAQVEVDGVDLLFQAGAVDAHLAGVVERALQEVGADADQLVLDAGTGAALAVAARGGFGGGSRLPAPARARRALRRGRACLHAFRMVDDRRRRRDGDALEALFVGLGLQLLVHGVAVDALEVEHQVAGVEHRLVGVGLLHHAVQAVHRAVQQDEHLVGGGDAAVHHVGEHGLHLMADRSPMGVRPAMRAPPFRVCRLRCSWVTRLGVGLVLGPLVQAVVAGLQELARFLEEDGREVRVEILEVRELHELGGSRGLGRLCRLRLLALLGLGGHGGCVIGIRRTGHDDVFAPCNSPVSMPVRVLVPSGRRLFRRSMRPFGAGQHLAVAEGTQHGAHGGDHDPSPAARARRAASGPARAGWPRICAGAR